MRYPRFFAPFVLLFVLGMLPSRPVRGASNNDELAKTLDDFRDRYFVANNGKDKLLAIQSLRMEASLTFADGRTGKIVYIKQKPKFSRTVWYGPLGVVIRTGFDGKTSWKTMRMPNGEEKGMIDENPPPDLFEWVIVDPEGCGATLELLPPERSDRSEFYHIRATFNDGKIKDYYMDAATFCESKVVSKDADGKMSTVIVENPKKFDGIWFPGVQIEYDQSGKELSHVEVEDVQMNIGLLPCFFDCPMALQNKVDEKSRQPATP